MHSFGGWAMSDGSTPETERDDTERVRKPHENAREVGGPKGPEPTRYGDWERKGRCIDF